LTVNSITPIVLTTFRIIRYLLDGSVGGSSFGRVIPIFQAVFHRNPIIPYVNKFIGGNRDYNFKQWFFSHPITRITIL